jgi:putative transcriptional regulator
MPSLTGSFLVARQVLTDPNFRQTVVLILEHSDEGAYGVVVNRPVTEEGLPVPVFRGGPCPSPGLVLLHGHREWADRPGEGEGLQAEVREVVAGVYVGDAPCLERVCTPEPGKTYRFRIFQGYAGWGAGQLEQELAAGAWAVVPATAPLLFDVPPEDLWADLCPRRIPEPSVN